jgi:hypothetical protein
VKRLALVALLVLAAGCGDEPPIARQQAQATDWPSLPGGWSELPAPPFVRARAVSVWTGAQLFYWGGDTAYGGVRHADGALFDPASREWRVVAPAPIGPRCRRRPPPSFGRVTK